MSALDRDKLIARLSEIVLSPEFDAADEADYIIETCMGIDHRYQQIEVLLSHRTSLGDPVAFLRARDVRAILRGDA